MRASSGGSARWRRRRSGPSLVAATQLAGRMVWRAARRTFLVSLLAEGIGIAGLAGVLLFGRALANSLSGDPPAEDLGAVLPSAIGLAASLLASGVAAVVVRDVRWLVAEQVTRHVKEQISDVASSVD